jgi:hypothetical protein
VGVHPQHLSVLDQVFHFHILVLIELRGVGLKRFYGFGVRIFKFDIFKAAIRVHEFLHTLPTFDNRHHPRFFLPFLYFVKKALALRLEASQDIVEVLKRDDLSVAEPFTSDETCLS